MKSCLGLLLSLLILLVVLAAVGGLWYLSHSAEFSRQGLTTSPATGTTSPPSNSAAPRAVPVPGSSTAPVTPPAVPRANPAAPTTPAQPPRAVPVSPERRNP